MMSSEDIRLLLELVGEETVVEPTKDFPHRVSKKGFGYSDNPQRARIQASLSMLLEVTSRQERGSS